MPCCTAQVGKKKNLSKTQVSPAVVSWSLYESTLRQWKVPAASVVANISMTVAVLLKWATAARRERVQLPLVSAVLPCKMITVGLQTCCCSSLCDHGNHKDHTEENYAVFWIIFEQIYLPTKIVWEQHKVWSLISQAGPVNSVVTTSLNHNQHTKTLHFHKQLFHQAVVHLPSCNLHGLQVKSTQKWQNLQW